MTGALRDLSLQVGTARRTWLVRPHFGCLLIHGVDDPLYADASLPWR